MTEVKRDPWARAEKSLARRERRDDEPLDLRDAWRLHHHLLADNHARIAASHRAKARALTLEGDAGA